MPHDDWVLAINRHDIGSCSLVWNRDYCCLIDEVAKDSPLCDPETTSIYLSK